MSVDDILRIDPQQISLRITINPKVEIPTEACKLAFETSDQANESTSCDLSLESVSRTEERTGFLKRKKTAIETFRLTEQSIDNFITAQNQIKNGDIKVKSFVFSFSYSLIQKEPSAPEDSKKLLVEIKLFEDQGYLVLIDK